MRDRPRRDPAGDSAGDSAGWVGGACFGGGVTEL